MSNFTEALEEIRILTDHNDHNEAVLRLATYMCETTACELMVTIRNLQKTLGYMPPMYGLIRDAIKDALLSDMQRSNPEQANQMRAAF